MKTAISIPNEVFLKAEVLARQRKISRSELYTEAIRSYLESFDTDEITAKLNAIYDEIDESVDPAVMKAQIASLPDEKW